MKIIKIIIKCIILGMHQPIRSKNYQDLNWYLMRIYFRIILCVRSLSVIAYQLFTLCYCISIKLIKNSNIDTIFIYFILLLLFTLLSISLAHNCGLLICQILIIFYLFIFLLIVFLSPRGTRMRSSCWV